MTEPKELLAEALWNSKVLTKGQAVRIADHLLEDFAVIPRPTIPEVHRDSWDGVNASTEFHQQIRDLQGQESPKKYWLLATLSIARAEYLEMEEVAAARSQEAAERARRRDELASEFTAVNSYSGQLPYTQKLIDRIIELEKKGDSQ